jgi:HPt (histidine-containing phosphotransfer) domain-containing protein
MTAHALEGSREACLSSGMDDYVSKPISALRLQTVLRKWISAEDKDSKGKDTRATAGDQSPIRLATLQETFSESDLKAIIDIFVKDALAEIEQIKTALKGKNTSSVLFHAHGLKGISGTVHADKMVLLCEEVEKACNRMLWADLPGLIEELEKELSALQRFVRDKGILVS